MGLYKKGFTLRGAWPSGFTLIELLVVIAIIGLLSTLAIVALGTARVKSRDARRLADLKSIQTALELYYGDAGGYPPTSTIALGDSTHACLNSTGFTTSSCPNAYLATIPKDPKGGYYYYSGTATDYTVAASLEGTVNNLTGLISVTPNLGISNAGTNGLVGYWPLDEGGMATTANDFSGQNNSGIWGGTAPYYSSGRVGSYCGQFNGSNVEIDTTKNALVGASQMSINAWIKPNAAGTVMFQNHGASDYLWRMEITGGKAVCEVYTVTSLANILTSQASIPLGSNFSLVTCTYDGAQFKIYVNGVLDNFMSASGVVASDVAGNVIFGHNAYAGVYSGLIDDIRIYNRTLSGAEIKALYDSQK